MLQEQLYTSELFKVIQGRNLINPPLQDNVIIPDGFFKYIYHVECAIKLHSIINSGLIPGGQKNWANDRQYSFCLWILWIRNIRILTRSTWKHRVLHGTCIQHGRNIKTRCIWVDIKLAQKKGLKFYQTRSERHHPLWNTRFFLDCKNTNLFVVRLHKNKDTDKDVDADRDRTERPVVIGQSTGSSTPFEEVDIDLRVFGLPHSVVQQAKNSRVRELVKKIENHPHRQDLQADLQQNNAYNPSSEESKVMIHMAM